MSGSSDPYRAIFERLVEKTRQKAEAKGQSIEKRKPKPKLEKKKCGRKKLMLN
jgi:hypothetical protein